MKSTKGSRKRGRAGTPSKGLDKEEEHLDEKDIASMRSFLSRGESELRRRAKEILNKDLIAQADAFACLEEKLDSHETYQSALDAGFVDEVRGELSKTYRIAHKLESWCQSLAPPLSAGGNAGVSGEVQDGIYSNIHGLTAGCSEALHRMLAFEKEHATQRTKCTSELVWERYRSTLETNMLHDVTKSILQAQSDIMNVANSVANNLSHLKVASAAEDKLMSALY